MIDKYKFEFTECCMHYINDLQQMVEDLDEELEATKADLQEMSEKYFTLKGAYDAIDSEHTDYKSKYDDLHMTLDKYKLRLNDSCIENDNLTEKLGAVRQLIIDNIMCGCDTDGNIDTFVTVDKINNDFEHLCELLDIREEDYTEHEDSIDD